MVLYCLKHFHIHHSINLSQKSWGAHGKNYYFCFTDGETEAQSIHMTFLRALHTKQKIPALTQNPEAPGKEPPHLKVQTQS